MEPNFTAPSLPASDVSTSQNLFGSKAHEKNHFVTQGEKKFDRLTYTTVGYVINALLSVVAVWAVERTHGGQKWLNNFVEGVQKRFPKVNPETMDTVARKTFFLAGGFAVLAPMKWLEDAKVRLVKKWDRDAYGDAVDTDPKIIQSHKDLEAAPKQSWGSVFSSRVLALVPFYITIGALWTRESALAKWTNPELRAMSKDAVKTMKENDPAKFSQIASKGFYVDKFIDRASRGIGKLWAKVSKNEAALAKLEEMETHYPGTIRSALEKDGSHDPKHSTMPYYFISEAITSGMVAWGVYALTRVLGPLMGKKAAPSGNTEPKHVAATVDAKVEERPQVEERAKVEEHERPEIKAPEHRAEEHHTKKEHHSQAPHHKTPEAETPEKKVHHVQHERHHEVAHAPSV